MPTPSCANANLNTVYPDFDEDDEPTLNPPTSKPASTAAKAKSTKTDVYGFTNDDIIKFSLDRDYFLKALQDPGEQNLKDDLHTHYPKLNAYSRKLFKHWTTLNFPNLPKNVTRVSLALTKVIVKARKLRDLSDLDKSFHAFKLKKGDETMFVINGDTELGGQAVIIRLCAAYYASQVAKVVVENRTPEQIIRLAAAMLDPDIRAPVSRMLSNKKHRPEMDQANNTYEATMELVLEKFKSPLLRINRPIEMDNVDPEGEIDPSGFDFWDPKFDLKWLTKGFRDNLKPKYKAIMSKWFKDTGGGEKTIDNFPNYCRHQNSDYPWMLWIYVIDVEAAHLLAFASGAKRPQGFISAESGYSATTGGIEDDDSMSLSSTPKRMRYNGLSNQMKESSDRMKSLVEMTGRLVNSVESAGPMQAQFTRLSQLQRNKSLVENDTDFNDEEKQVLLRALVEEKKAIVKKIGELTCA